MPEKQLADVLLVKNCCALYLGRRKLMRLSKYNEIIGRLKKIMINSMFRVPVENVTRKRGKIFAMPALNKL